MKETTDVRRTVETKTRKCFIFPFVAFICWLYIVNTTQYNVSNKLPMNSNRSRALRPLEKDHHMPCVEKNVSLSKTPLPLTGLVSFPGSGNTWTRHLMQQMTGLATSSVYCDMTLRMNGFPYECTSDRNRSIAVKTHMPGNIPMFKRIVLLIRNPYDAFLSFAHFLSAGHTSHPSNERLAAAADKHFEKSQSLYVDLVKKTTENSEGPVHILLYERLKTNTTTELRKLADFLNVSVTDRDIGCTVELQEGKFHRHTTNDTHVKLLQQVYSKDKLLQIHETARLTEQLLKDAYGEYVDLRGSIEDELIKER